MSNETQSAATNIAAVTATSIVASTSVALPDGDSNTLSLKFTNDSKTGVYYEPSGKQIMTVCDGTSVHKFNSSGSETTGRILVNEIAEPASGFAASACYLHKTSLNPALKLRSPFANESKELVGEFRYDTQTTNATPASFGTAWAPTVSEGMSVDAVVFGISSSNLIGGKYTLSAYYMNNAGTVSLIGAVGKTAIETDAGLDATLALSANTVRVQVTGIAATTIRWVACVNIRRTDSVAAD